MKSKIYGLLLASLMIVTLCPLSVSAKSVNNKAKTVTVSQTNDVITVSKNVKVNSTFSSPKALGIKKAKLKRLYNIVSDNTKVATVTAAGTVKGIKKGATTITLTSKADGSVYAKINVNVKNRYNKQKLRLMSAIIYAEAGSECYAGKKAVGIVIMNRVRSKDFPGTLKEVIYQPGQFGPVRNGSLKKALKLYDEGRLNKKCIKAAKATLHGDRVVTYKNVKTDMSSYLFFSGYVSGMRLQIQGHQFK